MKDNRIAWANQVEISPKKINIPNFPFQSPANSIHGSLWQPSITSLLEAEPINKHHLPLITTRTHTHPPVEFRLPTSPFHKNDVSAVSQCGGNYLLPSPTIPSSSPSAVYSNSSSFACFADSPSTFLPSIALPWSGRAAAAPFETDRTWNDLSRSLT